MDHLFTVQPPIRWNALSLSEQMRFQQILASNNRVIYRYMEIIRAEYNALVSLNKRKQYIIASNPKAQTISTRSPC